MKPTTKALIFLSWNFLLFFYFLITWYMQHKDLTEDLELYGETPLFGDIVELAAMVGAIYYSILTLWSFLIYKNSKQTTPRLVPLFIFTILPIVFIIFAWLRYAY
ncbi:hypothetical protein [Parasediminibacterium sp. JCM 36343]|uniref:hypothetical protein n=1 Tax=Parasediminibacterium sp. JCM 36343 TaxID=3374279 RepID=UPI00397A0D7E